MDSDLQGDIALGAGLGALFGAAYGAFGGLLGPVVFGLFFSLVGAFVAYRTARQLTDASPDAELVKEGMGAGALEAVLGTFVLGWGVALIILILMLFRLYYVEGLALMGLFAGPICAAPFAALAGAAIGFAVAKRECNRRDGAA